MADILPLRAPVTEPPADPAGKLPAPVRIGGRVVWRVSEIRAWLDAGAPDRETWEARRAARK